MVVGEVAGAQILLSHPQLLKHQLRQRPFPPPSFLAPTPQGGYLATAEACGTSPTITAQTLTNVRSGPGTAYQIIGELVFIEVRPIAGRAAETNWWQIILVDGRLGWVSNSVVQYSGNISGVPIIEAPLINGNPPTPSVPWIPANNLGCAPLPTWTAVAAAITEADATSENDVEATAEPTAEPNTATPMAVENEPTLEEAATTPAPEIAAVPLIINQDPDTETAVTQPIATAAPLTPSPANGPSSNTIFLILGALPSHSYLWGWHFLRAINPIKSKTH